MNADKELLRQLIKAITTSSINNLPRYKQLYEALRQQILTGVLLPGTLLPSSRTLATKLGIARNTAIAAIEQLCAEGYAESKPAAGIYVLPTAPIQWDISNYPSNHRISLGLSTRGLKLSKQAQTPVQRGAFTIGTPDVKQFPFELWQRYVVRHLRNPKLDWLIYPQQGGHKELRSAPKQNYLVT